MCLSNLSCVGHNFVVNFSSICHLRQIRPKIISESTSDSISNSTMMTCFCGEMTRFTSRTSLNPEEDFLDIENCEFWRWEDSSSENSSIEVNLLKSKLEVATLKMENLRESLNAIKIERDNLKEKLENLESLNYFEVNKSRNLEAKVLKLKILCILSFNVFVVFVVAIFK
ncbi:hypothetical protein H5410_062932 [Solanum commersonii]|uniref:Uncharacterized protein n=1 Tax=Solanum commersonii TaxID=4109 RepID=A0A9J5WE53_SOLCO|nr:hypothetical protein H5410_062932 [Solanum commersonii]